ncbi:PREDICTED: C-Myc-binding protein isoform X1 [Dinoponera quadriceps]|uniref:c-Myc-binding protein isoform X1 n=1 Tax=Dinoponera quadriceps TaxID=609295 RepID=A0A6P3XU55_DINQU|nr:PREDICTED: C-Myc-binding protein isoform X1 [Dinoponera quadriceps]
MSRLTHLLSGRFMKVLRTREFCFFDTIELSEMSRPIDIKREEFRKYLERSGVMEGLTKVLVMLYEEPEKPADALEYVRKHVGGIMEDTSEVDLLKKELDEAKAKIAELKSKLIKYETEETTTE